MLTSPGTISCRAATRSCSEVRAGCSVYQRMTNSGKEVFFFSLFELNFVRPFKAGDDAVPNGGCLLLASLALDAQKPPRPGQVI